MPSVVGDLLPFIVSSPSGAGKSTLCRRLLAETPDLFFSVSHTTRPARPGEQNGREYHFVDRASFLALVEQGAFLEWAEVHGNLYGTSSHELARARAVSARAILFDIDHQGARQIRARATGVVSVFILPPSWEELERRLRGRGSDDPAVIERRLKKARSEIEHYSAFDYLVVNDVLDDAFGRLRAILQAERTRRSVMAECAEALLHSADRS